jgi:hypothetical protein
MPMMLPVRNLSSLASWPLAAFAAVGALTAAFLALGPAVPTFLQAFITALAVVSAVGSWAVWNYPPIYFWRKRFASRIGRHIAPAWRLQVDYRSRVQPQDPRVETRLAHAGSLSFDRTSSRSLRVTAQATTATIDWAEPLAEEDTPGAPDWVVHIEVEYPPVPYHESVEFLRQRVMPLLEVLESAIDASPDRLYHLTVEYDRGNNPFEGILIRAAPDETISAYSVLIKPEGASEELIEINRERLALQAVSRSRFEELVERLLTLDGRWPVEFLRSLR